MELARIFEPVAADLARVELELRRSVATLAASSDCDGDILGRIVEHPFAVPGKRLRPALVLMSSRAAGYDGAPPLITLAAAVEILHAASLVHDDVIDGADTRRHQVSLNRAFGNRIAVLAGDILYTHFFSLITGMDSVEAGRRLALHDLFIRATRAMCMGEILAQERREAHTLSFADYRRIATAKTAVLFSASCSAPAILWGAEETLALALTDFGLHFGLAFQMIDDLMDGDYRLGPDLDLAAAAEGEARLAKASAAVLPDRQYVERLSNAMDFVLAQPIS